jgi:uncharacterized protein YjiS (DUF1127 family)
MSCSCSRFAHPAWLDCGAWCRLFCNATPDFVRRSVSGAKEYAMSVINLLISAGKALAARRQRRQTYGELMALDDHSLADIGLHRSQIAGLYGGVRTPDPLLPPLSFPKQEKFGRRKAA